MTRKTLPILALAIWACASQPSPGDFTLGASKSEILAEFGSPSAKQTMIMQTEAIFGPIETFWSTLEDGDRVDIWSYRIEGGSVELYYVNSSDTVAGTGFASDGVVY